MNWIFMGALQGLFSATRNDVFHIKFTFLERSVTTINEVQYLKFDTKALFCILDEEQTLKEQLKQQYIHLTVILLETCVIIYCD